MSLAPEETVEKVLLGHPFGPSIWRVDDYEVTQHALEALAIFYPKTTPEELVAKIVHGIPVQRPIARRLAGRGRDFEGDESVFYLHPERSGLFVLVPHQTYAGRWVVVTFLRFVSSIQYGLACRLWPGTEEHPFQPPTCKSPWINQVVPPPGEVEPKRGHAQPEVINFIAKVGVIGSCSKVLRDRFGGVDGLKHVLALAWTLGEESPVAGWEVSGLEPAKDADGRLRHVFHVLDPITGEDIDVGLIRKGKNPLRAVRVQPSVSAARAEQAQAREALANATVPDITPPPLEQEPSAAPEDKASAGFPKLPEQPIPGLGVPAREVRMSTAALDKFLSYYPDMSRSSALALVRWSMALLLLGATHDGQRSLGEGEFVAPGGVRLWLHRRPVWRPGERDSVEWWVCREPQAPLNAEAVALAQRLWEMGWSAYPPAVL